MSEDTSLTLNGAVKRIAPKVGVVTDTLRGWVRRAEIDAGRRPGTTTEDAASIRQLQAEVRDLKRATRSSWRPQASSPGAGPATAVVTSFIEAHRVRFGVVPICRVLTQQQSTVPAEALHHHADLQEHERTPGKAGADFDRQKNTKAPRTGYASALRPRVFDRFCAYPVSCATSAGAAGSAPLTV